LIGRVDAIGEQIAEMRKSNSAEHAAVIRAVGEVRDALDSKASKSWVKDLDGRTDSLERTRDEQSGAAKLVRVAQGAIVAALAIAAFILGRGGM
jgi:hypothetical protein